MMDEAAYRFALSGDKMDVALHSIQQNHCIPSGLFIDIMTEKCQLINTHLKTTREFLMIEASITNTAATISFHDISLCDSKFMQITLTNNTDLEDQLIYLWTEVISFLRYFQIDDQKAELKCIDTFYHDLEYNQMVAEFFNM